MQDLRIALVQAHQVWEDKNANLAHFSALLAETEQVDLILLPEMFQTGFSMNAEQLAEEGISCEVIDLRTVRPIDYDTVIASVKKTNRLVCVEEAWPLGSISTEIAYMVQKRAFDFLDAPIRRLTTADTPAAYAPTLMEAFLPSLEQVKTVVREVAYQNA